MVVLPQGKFAQFLHDGYTERLDALRHVLDLDIYSEIRSVASDNATSAKALAAKYRADIATAANLEAVQEAQQALKRLQSLHKDLHRGLLVWEQMHELHTHKINLLTDLTSTIELLRAFSIPEDVASIQHSLTESTDKYHITETALLEVESKAAQARQLLESGPDLYRAKQLLEVCKEHVELSSQQADFAANLIRYDEELIELLTETDSHEENRQQQTLQLTEQQTYIDSNQLLVNLHQSHIEAYQTFITTQAALDQCEKTFAGAKLEAEQTRVIKEDASNHNALRELVATLSTKEPCPVCQQPINAEALGHSHRVTRTLQQVSRTRLAGISRRC